MIVGLIETAHTQAHRMKHLGQGHVDTAESEAVESLHKHWPWEAADDVHTGMREPAVSKDTIMVSLFKGESATTFHNYTYRAQIEYIVSWLHSQLYGIRDMLLIQSIQRLIRES